MNIAFNGYSITNEHAASNYGIPVLVDLRGVACGLADCPHTLPDSDPFAMLNGIEPAATAVAAFLVGVRRNERDATAEQIEAAEAFYEQRAPK